MKSSCCNYCQNPTEQLPLTISNRPGLKAVAYRIGEYPDFRQALLNKLSLHENLKDLTERNNNDYSIALTDAWSMVADILSFYQERILNESYLRTATERFSVSELARLVGYELRAGVAASSYICFTLEEPQTTFDAKLPTVNASNLYGGSLPVKIDKGVKIQSIPEKDELPQIFETASDIDARIEWNNIRPRQELPQEPVDENVIFIKGTKNNIRKGDTLLLINNGTNTLKTVHDIILFEDREVTRLNLKAVVITPSSKFQFVFAAPLLVNYMLPTQFTNTLSSQIMQASFIEKDLKMIKQVNKWTDLEMKAGLNKPVAVPSTSQLYVFRKKVPLFGYNAPQKITIVGETPVQSEYSQVEKAGTICLDNAYEEILPGGYIAIQNPANSTSTLSYYKVEKAVTGVLTRYGISSKTTTLEIAPADGNSKPEWWGAVKNMESIRQAAVLAQSEQLSFAALPDESAVEGDSIVLDQYYPGLKEKQAIAISGEKQDLPGILFYEIAIIKQIKVEGGRTELLLSQALQNSYIRQSVFINANVALATHGETVQEILGSGNAARIFQKFVLKQQPLTYTSAPTPSGTLSSLELRINDILWHETDFFYNHGREDRVYITRRDNEGKTTVVFGDGINGARLPTGNNNVVATYRKGIGSPGILKAKQLSQLATKPLQVKSAINPVITSGAEDPEDMGKAKRNATLTILTLDRIVSLSDYEDFATAFPGVAKAHATWARRNNRQQVFLTIAGEEGTPIESGSPLYQNLANAIQRAGTHHAPLNLSSYTPRFFNIGAGLMIDPDFIADKVLEDAASRLSTQFSFASRKFMQAVSFSEVITCLQDVEGVLAVDIDNLCRAEDSHPSIQFFLGASLPAIGPAAFTGAELLTIAPGGINLKPII